MSSPPIASTRVEASLEGVHAGLVCRALLLVALCGLPALLTWLGGSSESSGGAFSTGQWRGLLSGEVVERSLVARVLLDWSVLCTGLCVSALAFSQARISRDPVVWVLGAALCSGAVFDGLCILSQFGLLGAAAARLSHPLDGFAWIFHAAVLLGGSLAVGRPVFARLETVYAPRYAAAAGVAVPLAVFLLLCSSLESLPESWGNGSAVASLALYLACGFVWLHRARRGRLSHVAEALWLSLIPSIAARLYLDPYAGWTAHYAAQGFAGLACLIPALGLTREYRAAYEEKVQLAADLEERHFQLDQTLAQALHDARHDPLTGLPNRAALLDRLRHAVAHARRYSHPVAVILVDPDRFRQINDSLGHEAGDAVLRQVAWRLARASRESDVVGRFGADVFGLVLYGATGECDASVTAALLRKSLAQPVSLQDRDVAVIPSLGIAFYPMDAEDPAALIRNAELALKAAKEAGGDCVRFFEPMMQQASQNAVETERELRLAIERKEFVLHYQPQIDLETGAVVGAEALLRWEHPERGMVPPLDFLPAAERTGLIGPIGAWVIQEACAQRALWSRQELPSFAISVNVSPEQFRGQPVAQQLEQALELRGVDGSEITCEVTETCVIRNPAEAQSQLEQLRGLGARVALDDFGTGYSSLSTLKQFPIDVIKIDRSFVSRMGTDRKQLSIVSAIVALAESLGLDTVAEGIETEQELTLLRDLGCAKGQGYYLSKPLPPTHFAHWLSTRL